MEQVKSFAKEYHKGSNLISSDESIFFVFKIKNYGISLNANVDIKEYITNTLNIESEVNIKDVNIYSSEIKISLMMIDSYMPNLLIYMIKYYYQTGDCRCSSLIKRIAEDDPFGYGESYIYEHKIALKAAQDSESGNVVSLNQYRLSPNKMQVGFIKSLRQLIENGQNKALLISATGTGKTYASAFGIRDAIELNDKMLFLVHREQIAKQALKSFKNVFGDTKRFGLLSGNSHDMDVDYLFSTMQMMAKPEIMEQFAKDEFPVIVIDDERVIIRTKLEEPSKIKGLALI